MPHPLLRVALDRPDLLVEHAGAYAALAAACARESLADWRWRAVGWVMLIVGIVLALGLGGVALMLHALLTPATPPTVLWLAPAVPALLAVAGAWLAHRRGPHRGVELSRLFEADLALFKET